MTEENSKQHELGVTPRSQNFSDWYNDVVRKADLVDAAPVRGAMIIKPYGYAIWENIQRKLDEMIKETNHQNAYFPLFIPYSFLQKEAEHVEGFSPQLAIVTHGGGKKLEEPLIVRPTSETIINWAFARWVKSGRDLPLLINQWANVVRWELRPRPFLRTTEFLWQEGHTAHATKAEAIEETLRMLDVYVKFANDYAAISVVAGQKSDSERFAGAVETYTIEAMTGDRRALQSATSHFLGQNFAKAFDIKFRNSKNEDEFVWQTSWGLSTRMVGAIVMAHGDDKGLILPPELAPVQVMIVPIVHHTDRKAEIVEVCERLKADLTGKRIRVQIDGRDYLTPGFKFNETELRGIPIRVEIGPADLEKAQIVVASRETGEKTTLPFDSAAAEIIARLEGIQKNLLRKNKDFRESETYLINRISELSELFAGESGSGFAACFHCGSRDCDERIKKLTGATNRCFPFNLRSETDRCIVCNTPQAKRAIFARSY